MKVNRKRGPKVTKAEHEALAGRVADRLAMAIRADIAAAMLLLTPSELSRLDAALYAVEKLRSKP